MLSFWIFINCLTFVACGHGENAVIKDDQNKPRGERNTTVFTREGENATLPCHLGPGNLKSPAFDWKKDSQEVFIYLYGLHDYTNGKEGQDLQFKGRVSLVPGGLPTGNASVILSNVTKKDIGEYKCILLPKELTSLIQLKMVVDPQLRLTIEEASGWARLSCVSTGGQPQPRGLVLQNQDGVELPAGPTTNSTDGSGRYSLHLELRVTKPGNYTCLALQGDVNPARDTRQYFGNRQSSTINWIISVISVVVVFTIVVICIYVPSRHI